MQFLTSDIISLKCYETCGILGLELCEPVLSIILKEKKNFRVYSRVTEGFQKIDISLVTLTQEINNGTYWVSNFKVKRCSEDCRIQETEVK